jgi:hypothetical protein
MTTPTPVRGPCTTWDPIWCVDLTSLGVSLAATGQALAAATEILYNRSAQQFDMCTFTVRPCRQDCAEGGYGGGWGSFGGGWGGSGGGWWEWGGMWPRPALIDGAWYNIACGGCAGTCSCTSMSIALLPEPVASITQIKINGEVLPASGYRVDDYRELVRLGGLTWPICQDMNLADTEPNTWSVTAVVGQVVPTIGQYAVGELALEILKSCAGIVCALPRTATTVTRQGVTIEMPTIYDMLDRKLLGLPYCDLFVSSYNPHGLASVPQVYDVDGESWRRTTWP